MPQYISGIFLDFDNVFGSLHASSVEAAINFASDPRSWLSTFSGMRGNESQGSSHKFVIRRCYMNPSGRIKGSTVSEYFSKYRQQFVRDGWEVIDTPQLTSRGKTSADIHIVMDVLDAVLHYPHVQEYIIMAADADYTPLVTRLRKHMKATVVYQAKATAAAYTAACNSVIGETELIELLKGQDEEAIAQGKPAAPMVSMPPITPNRVADAVHRYFSESETGHKAHVASIGNMLRDQFGKDISEDWVGFNSLGQLLKKLCNLHVETINNRPVAWREEGRSAN